MSFHLPRVAAKLGADFHDLSADDLHMACRERVAEDVHLDFKSKDSYTSTPSGLDELAKDVTALANAQGGLLVIGIAEDENGNADKVQGVELAASDSTVNKMHQGLRARVVPLYPAVEIRAVEDPSTPGYGFFLIGVPRSPLAPHAVRRTMRPEYSYSLRVGRVTAWLEETEIAARYRDRFRLAEDHVSRVREVFRRGTGEAPEGMDVANVKPQIYLEIAVVPAVSAERRVNSDFIHQMAGFYGSLARNTPLPELVEGFLGRQPLVQRGRLRLHHHLAEAEWYADGSCFVRSLVSTGHVGSILELNFTWLELRILAILQIAASYVNWSGAYGDADVLARTVGASTVFPDHLPPAQQRSMVDRRSVRRSSNEPTHLTVPLHAVLAEPTQLLICAHSLAADLLADYGQAETTFIRADGSVLWQRLKDPARSQVQAWMTNGGLLDS